MTLAPLQNALSFLIDSLLSMYIFIVMLRFLFQLVKADFYNPISNFVVKVTTPLLRPLRKFIPGFGGIDFASVFLLLALEFIKTTSVLFIQGKIGAIIDINTVIKILIINTADLTSLAIKVFYFAMLIQVIASWIPALAHNPNLNIIYQLTNPLLSRIRKFIPLMGGFDISPIFGFLFLTILDMTVVTYIKIIAASI